MTVAGRSWARRNRPVAERNEKAERGGRCGPAVEGIGCGLGDGTAAERSAALAAVGRGGIDDQIDVTMGLGDLLECLLHARWIGHVGSQRERAEAPDAFKGGLGPRGPGHRPALCQQELDDRLAEVARAKDEGAALSHFVCIHDRVLSPAEGLRPGLPGELDDSNLSDEEGRLFSEIP